MPWLPRPCQRHIQVDSSGQVTENTVWVQKWEKALGQESNEEFIISYETPADSGQPHRDEEWSWLCPCNTGECNHGRNLFEFEISTLSPV
jgi:hypothetical protein